MPMYFVHASARCSSCLLYTSEPWDKFISVACGRVFGAWVDLRPGASFGLYVRAMTAKTQPTVDTWAEYPQFLVYNAGTCLLYTSRCV